MLQQLALETHAVAWAVASMIFFMSAFAFVLYRVARTPQGTHEAHGRLPLEDGTADLAAGPRTTNPVASDSAAVAPR